jgi:hypothetical protein
VRQISAHRFARDSIGIAANIPIARGLAECDQFRPGFRMLAIAIK